VFEIRKVLCVQVNEVVHTLRAWTATPLFSAQPVQDEAIIAGAPTVGCWRSILIALDASYSIIAQVAEW